MFLTRYPPRSPKSHCPTSRVALFLIISSTFCSSSVARISPATLRHCGLLSSYRMPSMRFCSFSRVSRMLRSSPPSSASFFCMYSLMQASLSLKALSKMALIRYLRLRNSALRVLAILALNMSSLQLRLATSPPILPVRLSRHCIDSSRADSKLEVWATRPFQTSLGTMLLVSGPLLKLQLGTGAWGGGCEWATLSQKGWLGGLLSTGVQSNLVCCGGKLSPAGTGSGWYWRGGSWQSLDCSWYSALGGS